MFDSAEQKIERADYHIADLERQFAAFVASKPHRFNVHTDPNSRNLTIRIRFLQEPPRDLALIIGDAVHNLRTALDHAMWEIVGYDGGTQDRYLQFPTGDNRINFESSCNGIKTPSQWVKEAIKATEAFVGGRGDSLYQLNRFDVADKHTAVTPVLRATSHPRLRIIAPDGTIVATVEGNVFIGGAGEFANIANTPMGYSVELDDDAQCPPSIFFGHSANVTPGPVFSRLRDFAQSVALAIHTIKTAMPR